MTDPVRVRELGRGASATVYEAVHRGARVAFKVLDDPGPHERAAFERVRGLAHAGLAGMREWIDGAGFTMDLVEGGVDVLTWVRGAPPDVVPVGRPNISLAFGQRQQPEGTSAYTSCDPVGVARLRGALVQLIEALHYMHGASILHGDLRPSNVLVTAEGRVTLLDFGLSRAHDDASSYEASTAYGPPEVVPSPHADWYALGTIVFECLTGQLPFLGSAQHVLVTKATVPPPSPSFLVAGVPGDLDALTMGLLSRNLRVRIVAVDTYRRGLLSSTHP